MEHLAWKMTYVLLVISLFSAVHASRKYSIPLRTSPAFTAEDVLQDARDESKLTEGQKNNLKGKPGMGYYIEMGIGTPPQTLNILVDTGSSNFAVASTPHPLIDTYFNTSLSETFRNLTTAVSVPYTQGNWAGYLASDLVTVTTLPEVNIQANIACIDSSKNFFINGSHWEGILGLAYAEVARPDSSVEPFYDSLMKQTDIADVFSMQLCGTVDTSNQTDVSMGGTLIIGGTDEDLYKPPILYVPIHKQWYYEVIITKLKVADEQLNMDCKEFNFDKTIVDSGTTNLRLPEKVFEKVVALIEKHTHPKSKAYPEGFFEGTKLLCWAPGNTTWDAFPEVTIGLAMSSGSILELIISPQQYLRAVPQHHEDCYKFAIATSKSGTVLGAVIMEGYYVIFDRQNRRIGWAKSTCKNRDPSAATADIQGPFNVTYDTLHCAYTPPKGNNSALVISAYVMAGLCGLCLLPVLFMVGQWQYRRCMGQKRVPTDDSNLLDGEFEVDSPTSGTGH